MIVMRIKGSHFGRITKLEPAIKNALLIGMEKGINLIIATATKKYLSGPYPAHVEATDTKLRLKKGLWGKAELSNVRGRFVDATVGDSEQFSTTHEGPSWATASWGRTFTIRAKTPPTRDEGGKQKGGMSFLWERFGVQIWHIEKVRIRQRPFLKPAILDNILNIKSTIDALIKKSVGGP